MEGAAPRPARLPQQPGPALTLPEGDGEEPGWAREAVPQGEAQKVAPTNHQGSHMRGIRVPQKTYQNTDCWLGSTLVFLTPEVCGGS